MAYGNKNTISKYAISFRDFTALLKDKEKADAVKLYLFYGEEEMLIEKSIKTLQKMYIAKGAESMDYAFLDFDRVKPEGKDDFLDMISDSIGMPAWMSSKRVVLVRNSGIFSVSDPKKNMQKKAEEVFKSLSENILLIFYEKVDLKKTTLLKLFSDYGKCVSVNLWETEQVINFINNKLSKNNITIDTNAAETIAEICDCSLRCVSTEVEKLSLYCAGSGTTRVDMDLVSKLCPPDIKGKIFDMTDAIGYGRADSALEILHNLIFLKEPVGRISFMFSRQIRNLICAKECGNANRLNTETGMNPYAAGKMINQARNFSMEQLLGLYSRCADYDLRVRQGLADELRDLECLIILAASR